jgi:predicted phosphodiesterase
MRLAIVSDIHGNLPALEAVLTHARRSGFDAIVNLGDIASGPLWPRETVEYLMMAGWTTLAGNHERQVLTLPPDRMGKSDAFAAGELGSRHKDWLRALPANAWPGDQVFACHGTPGSDLVYWLETVTDDFGRQGSRGVRAATPHEAQQRSSRYLGGRDAAQATLALCGHTHVPRAVQLPGGPLVVNPGSVGLPAYDDTHPHWHFVENGSPHARYALAERGPHGWHVDLRAVAYDWEHAAQRAQANGRPDWADALRTGRVNHTEVPLPAHLAAPAS